MISKEFVRIQNLFSNLQPVFVIFNYLFSHIFLFFFVYCWHFLSFYLIFLGIVAIILIFYPSISGNFSKILSVNFIRYLFFYDKLVTNFLMYLKFLALVLQIVLEADLKKNFTTKTYSCGLYWREVNFY